ESWGTAGSKALYLSTETRDNPHTSVHGATVSADHGLDALVAQGLGPEGRTRAE
ncbi:carbohydrate esterase, partial [Streptomyces sp. SP18BB07]|nr:carbohydrate esterase [Streptomyces sp. SP18BB07]